MLLPLFGGSPAVWSTALLFFQVLLVGGYLYAHLMSRWARSQKHWLLHVALLGSPLLLLPPALPAGIDTLGTGAAPQLRLLAALATMVGAPYFFLSTNSSLIQHWWSQRGRSGGRDPYWLFAASNAGSLLALLSYSIVVEPLLAIPQQTVLWSVLYAAFVAVTLWALTFVRPNDGTAHASTAASQAPGKATGPERSMPADGTRVFFWVLRAAVAVSLLMSCTLQISSDLAPTPLFWVVPLALYLVTFIVAFGAADRLPRKPLVGATVVMSLATAGMLVVQGLQPFGWLVPVSLGTLFCGALLCHCDLATDRPAADGLTSFYLWICLGGAVGGVLNGLVAPLVFDSVAELPLTLILLSALIYIDPRIDPGKKPKFNRYRPPLWTGFAAAVAFAVPIAFNLHDTALPAMLLGLAALAALVWGFCVWRYPGAAGLSIAIICALFLFGGKKSGLVAQERSFFGVSRVRDTGDAIEMIHGSTVHGRQLKDEKLHPIPVAYYYAAGPLGATVRTVKAGGRIGVIGLGTGSLAAFTDPGQQIVFYEIDPTVAKLARRHFSFLSTAAGHVRVVIGDGRLAVAREAVPFDLLVIDAFSSDFVPTHLLTDEALTLFLDKTAADGLLLFHITNRHADLRRVLKGYARSHGVHALETAYAPDAAAKRHGVAATTAVALSRRPGPLKPLLRGGLWKGMDETVPAIRWTDGHADVLSVLY